MQNDQHVGSYLVDSQLLSALKGCTTLPSPPVVACRIIELAQSPGTRLDDVADVIRLDPALTAKILRITNSPLYALRRKPETLQQAILYLGLNATITLALSFSLVTQSQAAHGTGMDYPGYWKRSVAAATCCRRLATTLQIADGEEAFLAGLLQDIGMLALARLFPDLYRHTGQAHQDHRCLCETEQRAIGDDHAGVGGWLLGQWGLPERLRLAVAGSHDPRIVADNGDLLPFVSCVSLSGPIVDIARSPDGVEQFDAVADLAAERLGLNPEDIAAIMASLEEDLKTTGELFDTDLGVYMPAESLLDQARESLVARNLRSLQEAAQLKETADRLATETRRLEDARRLDSLTGVYNRAHLDQVLEQEFTAAKSHRWPVAVMFVDLDHFKTVNDHFGHQAGDHVLRETGRLLSTLTRTTDFVARYGGEEFVIVLPGCSRADVPAVAERIVAAFRRTRHMQSDGQCIAVTASVGLAVQGEESDFADVEDLIRAADDALYAAKRQGRDRYVTYGVPMDAGDMAPSSLGQPLCTSNHQPFTNP